MPLSVLVTDIVAGDVEFRDASRDLPRLLMRDGGVDVVEERTANVRVKVKLEVEVDTTFWSDVAWKVLWRGVVGDLGWKFDVSSCVSLCCPFVCVLWGLKIRVWIGRWVFMFRWVYAF